MFYKLITLKEIILPESLTSINEYAFYGCSSLTQINIPQNVNNIGQFAFASSGLTSIILPNKLQIISNNLFGGCSYLSMIMIPNNITRIESQAFYNCINLEHIELPDNVTFIGDNAFYKCQKLTKFTLPKNLIQVEWEIIDECSNIKNITIPKTFNRYTYKDSRYPLTGSSIETVIYEEGCSNIIKYMFYKLITLKEIILPESLTSINEYAFYGCSSLTQINIPQNVNNIGQFAFASSGLTSIILPNKLQIISNNLFGGCSELKTVRLTDNITDIGEEAFYNCQKLEKIDFPDQIITINENTFYNCISLKELILPKNLQFLKWQFISGCTGIKNITIPNSVKKVWYSGSNWPFTGSFIQTVIFEDGITFSLPHAFYKVTTLQKVVFPESLTLIQRYSFYGCTSLTQINIPNNVSTIEEYAFYGCTSLTQLNIPNNVSNIEQYAFAASGLTSLILPNILLKLSNNILCQCYSLSFVIISENVTDIGRSAFYSCNNLDQIYFNQTCQNYSVINLPNSLKSIGEYAFSLTSITSINIPDKVSQISSYMFQNCSKLSEVNLSQNIKTIMKYSFNNCIALKKIKTYDLITTIEDYAFQNCQILSRIDLFSDVSSIASYSFSKCPLITLRVVAGSYSENYARSKNIKFTYLYEVVSLMVKIITDNCTDMNNMKLILKNTNKNIENIISTIQNESIYVFNGLLMDDVYNLSLVNQFDNYLFETNNIIIETNATNIEIVPYKTFSINVSVFDVISSNVTPLTTIKWFDEKGRYLTHGSFISQIINGTQLQCQIDLNDQLAIKYYAIQPQSYMITDDTCISIQLVPFKIVTLCGQIINETGDPINQASIFVSQKIDTSVSHDLFTFSNKNGKFTLEIYNINSSITISDNNYISKTIEITNLSQNIDVGSIVLAEITGRRINIYFKQINTVSESDDQIIKDGYNDYENMRFNLYNSVTNEQISDFIYQYSTLILPYYIEYDFKIKITASANSDDFNPVTVYANPEDNNITITLVQKGFINILFEKSKNANNVVMLYDNKGKLVDKFDFHMNSAQSIFLNDGDYTAIIIGKSDFFNNIQSLDSFSASKLVSNRDYVSRKLTVKSGKITNVKIVSIPKFDDSRFYYTDNTKTSFVTNRASAVAGAYFSFKGHVEFKEQYKNNVTNIKFLIDIPDNIKYLEGSLIIDKKIISYTFANNIMKFPINIYDNIIRLTFIPTKSGSYNINAFIEFQLENETIRQPINTAKFDAKDMTFFIPKKTGKTNVLAYGTAAMDVQLFLYDNDVLVSKISSGNSGEWLVYFDLANPSTYSRHFLYIKAVLPSGIEFNSKKKTLIYNQQYIDVSTITVITQNSKTVLHYPRSKDKFYYTAGSRKTDMTFLINFTNNDPQKISNVRQRS